MFSETSVRGRQGTKFAMLALSAALIGGCATAVKPQAGATSTAMAKPAPRAENCAVVTVGTPVKFACDGKVYTSWALQHLRDVAEDPAKN